MSKQYQPRRKKARRKAYMVRCKLRIREKIQKANANKH
jgi:hypothetical protein